MWRGGRAAGLDLVALEDLAVGIEQTCLLALDPRYRIETSVARQMSWAPQ
jgi:hypothetical protein